MNSVKSTLHCTGLTVLGFFRQKSTVCWMMLFPILLTTIFCSVLMSVDINEPYVYVQNMDGDSQAADVFIDELDEKVSVRQVDPELGRDRIAEMMKEDPGSPMGVLTIPEGFNQWLTDGMSPDGSYEVLLTTGDRSFAIILDKDPGSVTSPYLHYDSAYDCETGESLDVAAMFGMDGYMSVLQEMISDIDNVYVYFLPTMILAVLMQTLLGFIIGMRCTQRESHIMKIMGNTKIGPFGTAAMCLLWSLFPTLICSILVFGVTGFFSDLSITPMLPLSMVFVSFSIAAFGLLLSTMMREGQNSTVVASVFTIPLLLLSGCLVPFEFLSPWVSSLSRYSPVTYAANLISGSMTVGYDPLYDILMLALFTFIMICGWVLIERGQELRA